MDTDEKMNFDVFSSKIAQLERENTELIAKNNRLRKYLNRYQVAYYSFAQMCVYESQKDTHVTHSQRQALAEVRNQILHELGIELGQIPAEAEDTEFDPIPF